MALTDAETIAEAIIASGQAQPKRTLDMLGLWVSEIDPEIHYDTIFAPGRSRSTVHWSGRPAYSTYSYDREFWSRAYVRHAQGWIVDNEEPYPGDRERAYWRKFCRDHGISLGDPQPTTNKLKGEG